MAGARSKEPSLSVIAHHLAAAMAFDVPVQLALRTRPPRAIVGKVTRRYIDERKRIDPKDRKDRSNLVVVVNGEHVDVERISSVRRAST